MYARGILFGKMKYELGDEAVVKCPESGLEVDIDFKVKGWMGGTYNAIGGYIKDTKTGKNLFELSGYWSGAMYIKDLATGKKELLFDASHAKESPVQARPLNEQQSRESQKLWDSTTRAIKRADQRTATDEKTKIEEEQRKEAAERGDDTWEPKLFKAAPSGDEQKLDWIIDAQIDNDGPAEKQIKQILAIAPILPGQGQSQGNVGDSSGSPSQQQQKANKTSQPTSGSATGDLIDFGQNDPPSNPSNAGSNGSLQQSSKTTGGSQPGGPLLRMDSMGGEDAFVDAEP